MKHHMLYEKEEIKKDNNGDYIYYETEANYTAITFDKRFTIHFQFAFLPII